MNKYKFNKLKKSLISILFIIALDVFIYIILGVLLMDYEDNYQPSMGEIWSLGSMNFQQKIYYLSYNVWVIIHIFAIIFIMFKFYLLFKNTKLK
jgi:hypothetical protein